jgi:hypothetical protein
VDRTKLFHEDLNILALTVKDVISVDNLPKWLLGSEENWERLFGDDWRTKFPNEWVAINDQTLSKDSSIVTLSVGQMVTNIALYVLSRKKNELVPHCHYLAKGILGKVIEEQISFGATLSEFLNTDEWAYKKLV